LFPPLKIRLKGRHFDTTEVIEAESQAVLNTLTEHDFQDVINILQKRLGTVQKPTSRMMVVSRPKASFYPDGSISLGNYG
jgi:hypothetical protein